jgi:hypothetical protein
MHESKLDQNFDGLMEMQELNHLDKKISQTIA